MKEEGEERTKDEIRMTNERRGGESPLVHGTARRSRSDTERL